MAIYRIYKSNDVMKDLRGSNDVMKDLRGTNPVTVMIYKSCPMGVQELCNSSLRHRNVYQKFSLYFEIISPLYFC